jgi:hypothetical protein
MEIVSDGMKAAAIIGSRHWRIWEWINAGFARAISKRPVRGFTLLRDLWTAALNDEIADGDYVELSGNWRMCEWVPRSPGRFWLEYGLFGITPATLARLIANRDPLAPVHGNFALPRRMPFLSISFMRYELESSGASLVDQGFLGLMGIFRPPLAENADKYALLSCVTPSEYLIDLGFPVLASSSVYRALQEAGLGKRDVSFECRARIIEANRSAEFSQYIRAAGAVFDPGLKDILETSIGIRNIMLYLDSPLDISIRESDSHPEGFVRIEGVERGRRSKDYGRNYLLSCIIGRMDPSALPSFGPTSPGAIFPGFARELSDWAFAPITDFDARVHRLACALPTHANPRVIVPGIEGLGAVIDLHGLARAGD